MPKNLKLYVWESVLCDYSPGIAFALADSVERARQMCREDACVDAGSVTGCTCYVCRDLQAEPDVYDAPFAFTRWGRP